MAKKKKKSGLSIMSKLGTSQSKKTTSQEIEGVSKETVQKFLAVFLIILAVLHVFGVFKSGGYVGEFLLNTSLNAFGIFGYLLSIFLTLSGYYLFRSKMPEVNRLKTLQFLSFSILLLTLFSLLGSKTFSGYIGQSIANTLVAMFSIVPSIIFVFLGLAYSLVSLIGIDVIQKIKDISESLSDRKFELPKVSIGKKDYYEDEEAEIEEEIDVDLRSEMMGVKPRRKKPAKEEVEEYYEDDEDTASVVQKKEQPKPKESPKSVASKPILNFTPPPLSLLQRDSGKASVGDTKANMATIKRTLAEFGIQVEMDEVSIGPSVTRYTLKPAQGVKLSRIANHRQELAYALRAESIRIEAPIPGKALVGIEIPNQSKSMVGLASLLASPKWSEDQRPLLVALGKGISGTPLYSNLAKMPHVLIAGTTGSGKSVMVHALINSLLFRNDPTMLKFIMVDPKKVELTLYNNIPHLYTPVITNAKVAIRTLNWAVNEMERRYDVLEENSERDIGSYHKNIYFAQVNKKGVDSDDLPERMPYIVVIIDELADIMMSYPKELEAAIVRLAQKSRAVGIHLILSTQRPSVNVITGLIKANIPSRIALKVASQIDSRTIIDTAGAEQLLGQGDLLFTSSESPKQERVQSAFVSDGEVKNVVEYLKKTYRDFAPEEINIETTPGGDKTAQTLFSADLGSGGDTDDDLYEQAKEIVISSKKASTSYLQRRLKIGYSRAARLMDMLEENGVIGAADGAKPREVLALGFGGGQDDDMSGAELEDEE